MFFLGAVIAVILLLIAISQQQTGAITATTDETQLIPSSTDTSDTVFDFSSSLESLLGMSRYNASQIKQFAMDAGFSGNDLNIAVAIALAESGGNAKAYNPETAANTPDNMGSYGLWQIYLKAHPEFQGVDLFDPPTNALAAFQVYTAAGSRFTPWSTFKNQAYLNTLSTAIAA